MTSQFESSLDPTGYGYTPSPPQSVYGGLSPAEIREALAQREREMVESALESAAEAAPAVGAGSQEAGLSNAELRAKISDRAYTLIVDLETGGRAYYESPHGLNKRPVWPGGSSGVTIGCGYDLGYHTRAEFEAAWSPLLEPRHMTLLAGAIGKTGAAARDFMPRVAHIVIEWGAALAVFDAFTVPKYTRLMVNSLPDATELHSHSFGALVSLVFNRGASFSLAGDRYREMREIARLMAARKFAEIPAQFLAMKRLWVGAGLGGLLIRRNKEAELFQAGLDATRVADQPVEIRRRIRVGGATEIAAAVDVDADLDWLQSLTQDQLDVLLYEGGRDDATSVSGSGDFAEAAAIRYQKSDVRWVQNDQNHPDYTHLPPDAKGQTFAFTADDLDVLITRNRFEPKPGPHKRVLFALRGAELVGPDHAQEQRAEIKLTDIRPDHMRFRCVIGVYDTGTRKLSAYTGSTVCNAGGVVACYNFYNGFAREKQGNILPTGCYEMCVGTHHGSVTVPGVFRLGSGPEPDSASKQTVLRSANDVIYGTRDIWDPCTPNDNLHPAFGTDHFSSLGCLTVRGTYRGQGRHEGEWGKLRGAAGLNSGVGMGTRFDMVLLTGLDAATVASLRARGITDDAALDEAVGCLRKGSQGPLVKKLQAKLSLQESGDFDWKTALALAEFQKGKLGWASGTYGRTMDVLLGFEIFGPAVVA